MDAGELLAHRANQKCRHNRAVNTARKGQQDLLVSNLTAKQLHLVFHKILHVPVGLRFANIKQKGTQRGKQRIVLTRKFFEIHFLMGRGVVNHKNRYTGAVNIVRRLDGLPVDNIVASAVYNNPLEVGLQQLFAGQIVCINFTVYTQFTHFTGHPRIFLAAQIQNCNEILLHTFVPAFLVMMLHC